ncbi:MAG TPA: hypothetical protein VLD62_00205, partial [Acidimicrobiia bacterium]|nr:hypothetical protein [Acidimicrobiia bacterium]
PHLDPHEAASFVARTADIPYLAQLPNRHPEEGMLLQWGDGLCGCGAGGALGLEFGAREGDRSEAFVGAEVSLAATIEATVKTQATGPVTLGLAMLAGGHPGGDDLWSCVVEGLVDRIASHLARIAGARPDVDVVLVLDEPALGTGDPDVDVGPAREVLAEIFDRLPLRPGIHCCGDAPWSALLDLRPSSLSFDPSAIGRGFERSIDDLARAVSEGTRIIWGAVPTVPPPLPSLDLLVSRIRRIEGALVMAGADLRRLGDAWVSPACGMSGLTEDQALVVARRTAEVAEELH